MAESNAGAIVVTNASRVPASQPQKRTITALPDCGIGEYQARGRTPPGRPRKKLASLSKYRRDDLRGRRMPVRGETEIPRISFIRRQLLAMSTESNQPTNMSKRPGPVVIDMQDPPYCPTSRIPKNSAAFRRFSQNPAISRIKTPAQFVGRSRFLGMRERGSRLSSVEFRGRRGVEQHYRSGIGRTTCPGHERA